MLSSCLYPFYICSIHMQGTIDSVPTDYKSEVYQCIAPLGR